MFRGFGSGAKAAALGVLAAALGAALLMGRLSGREGELPGGPEGAVEPAERASPALPRPSAAPGPAHAERAEAMALTPGEVIDKPRFPEGCRMARGGGPASDLAVVFVRRKAEQQQQPWNGSYSWPARYSRKFSVLDEAGAVHSGELPFTPYQIKLGKTPGGEVVMGFGAQVMPDRPYGRHVGLGRADRLRIYEGARIAHEGEAWLFDVASDASSYFTIGPGESDYSAPRLAIANRIYGTEAVHDLGGMLVTPEGDLAYLASYTPSNEEVHLRPWPGWLSRGMGTHYFFKAQGGGPPRKIPVADRGLDDLVEFVSSEEGYFLWEAVHGSDTLQVAKASYSWDGSGGRSGRPEARVEWRARGPVNARANGMDVSPNGAWFLFSTATAGHGRANTVNSRWLYVLDTTSGEAVFKLPTLDTDAQINRLRNVLPSQPTADDVGWFNGAFFAGGDKLVVRRLRRGEDGSPGSLGKGPVLFDVYDMNFIYPGALPMYRVESNEKRENPCASSGFPGSLFATEDGKLAYAALQ